MAEDSVLTGRPVEITVVGDLAEVPADIATPLAVALAELLQNAVEHAFVGEGAEGAVGHIGMRLRRERGTLYAEVRDNGRGIPEGFSIDTTSSLGLSIVRDLIKAQLEGEMEMTTVPAEQGGGTLVSLRVPIIDRRSLHPTARPKG